jgi:hypothetical protein
MVLGWRGAVVGACALMLFGACTEGDEPMLQEERDASRADAALRQDARAPEEDASDEGEMDAASLLDAAREPSPTANCGSPAKVCTAHAISGVGDLAAGCALNFADAEVCGISSQHVLMGAEPKFLEKNAKGVASPSCGAFYDALELVGDAGVRDGGAAGNGRIDKGVTVALNGVPTTLRISYPGCCTERGFCSADGNKGMSEYGMSQSGFGCMESGSFFRYLPEVGAVSSAAEGLPLRAIPCERDSGVIMLPDRDASVSDAGSQDAGATDAATSDAGEIEGGSNGS